MRYIIDINISIFNKLIFLKRLGLKMKVVCPPYFGWNYVAVNCIILCWCFLLNVDWPQPVKGILQ